MDKQISDLEHALIKKEIENISFKMHEGFRAIEKNITLNFEALRVKNDAEAEVHGIQLDNILIEQKRTNGRVTNQEKTTEVLKVMQDNRTFTALVVYSLYNFLDVATIQNIWGFIKSIF